MLPEYFIKLVYILLALLVVIVFAIIGNSRREAKKKEKYAIFAGVSGNRFAKSFRTLYDVLENFFLTKRFMRNIRRNQEFLYPGDEYKIVRGCVRVAGVVGGVIVGAFLFLLSQRFSFYGNCIFILTVYFAINEIVSMMLTNKNVTLLKSIDSFITDVRHFYFEYEMVDEAVEEAIENAEPLMKLHGQKIYDVLTSTDQEGEVISYNETIPNRFLRTLLANCTMVMKFGDTKKNGESIFLRNLRDLKREISIEARKREKAGFIFSSMSILCIAPLYFMPACKNWCLGNLPSLESFYSGSLGILMQILIFATSLICYNLIRKMKEDSPEFSSDHPILDYLYGFRIIGRSLDSITAVNYSRTLRIRNVLRRSGAGISVEKFYLKRFIFAVFGFVFGVVIFIYGHELDKHNILTTVVVDEEASSSFINHDYAMLEPTVLEFINSELNSGIELPDLEDKIYKSGKFRYVDASNYAARLTLKQIDAYHSEQFMWYELLICFMVAIFSFFLPYLLLLSKEKAIKMQMDDEVIQFQSVILMLIYMPNVTVEIILEWMCDFAVIFKPSLMECLDNYAYGDIDALEKLMEDEPFQPFERIVKNLISCHRIGIEAAFNEISVDRENYQESRKQDNEITLEKKSASSSMISMLPFGAVMIFYLVGPFIYGALQMLGGMESMMKI